LPVAHFWISDFSKVRYVLLMIIGSTPWWLALLTAAWFALQARAAGRSWVLWGFSGGLFALVASTLFLGLGHALTIPFSDHDRSSARTEWTIGIVLIIAALGFVFTVGLIRQTLAPRPAAPPATPPSTPVNPPQPKPGAA